MERTFVMLKPDALHRGKIGEIIERFERKGLKIVGMKMVKMTQELCDVHYAHHKDKPFFKRLVDFVCSSPVICMVLEGRDAVEQVRKICGATDCGKADPGTIRGDLGMSVQSNLIHASDSGKMAEEEIERFFRPDEIYEYKLLVEDIMYGEDER